MPARSGRFGARTVGKDTHQWSALSLPDAARAPFGVFEMGRTIRELAP